MTNIEARKQARAEVRECFTTAGFVDGISLTAPALDKETKPCFWHGVVRCQMAKDKNRDATYYLPSSLASIRADNKAYLREVTVAVDVFSKQSFDAKYNMDILSTLENTFTTQGFEVEFADEIYEEETGLFHYPLTLYKNY
jgi:hypothetical protein